MKVVEKFGFGVKVVKMDWEGLTKGKTVELGVGASQCWLLDCL